jgi:hypothetical protein
VQLKRGDYVRLDISFNNIEPYYLQFLKQWVKVVAVKQNTVILENLPGYWGPNDIVDYIPKEQVNETAMKVLFK